MNNSVVVDRQPRKAIVVGIDGAVWELLDRWLDDDTLVNLKRVIEKGVKGNLASTLPPVTAPAWVSFATGANPGKHGCYDFVLPKGDLDSLRTITSRDICTDTIYEHLRKFTKNSILINLPVTFPPKTDDVTLGCLITKGDDYVFPAHLKEELPTLKNYRIVPDMRLIIEGQVDAYIKDISKLEHDKFSCVKELLDREWDLFFVLFSGTDWIQHIMYHQLLETTEDQTVALAKQFYKQIDDYIGWFFDNLPEDTTLILMSDHGFKAYKGYFCINEWLKAEGYLNTKPKSKEQPLPHLMMEKIDEAAKERRERISNELKEERRLVEEQEQSNTDNAREIKMPRWLLTTSVMVLRPLAPVYRWAKDRLGIQFEATSVTKPEAAKTAGDAPPPSVVDLEMDVTTTQAFCPTYQSASVYINLEGRFNNGIVATEEYEGLRDELISKLSALTHPTSGAPVFTGVLKKEDVYKGSSLDEAPDIILVRNDYEVNANFSGKVFIEETLNGHAESGIFVAAGNEVINSPETLGDLSISDISPTILHVMNVPIPDAMDGRVLFEIFKEDSEIKNTKPRHINTSNYEDKLKQKIKKLKNLGKI